MTNQHRSFEARRAERRRRERRRKKRIRALFLLICFIALIVFIIMAFASCNKDESELPAENDITATETFEPLTPLESAVPETPAAVTFNNIPSPGEENDLLEIIEKIDNAGGEKVCYLTFDDGPSDNVTPKILDTLRRYNIKATFFQVGSIIESNPDMARRVYEEGHLIANHSQSHNYDKLYDVEEDFITEVKATEEIIKEVTGEANKFPLFRFPGGSYNAGDHAEEKQIYKETLAENGFYYVDWDSLNGDAQGRTKNASQLLEYFKDSFVPNKSTVVLMHDASAKKATAESLPSIIEYLIDNGYTFKRLDEIDYTPVIATPSPSPAADSTYDSDDYSSYDEDESYSDDDDSSYSDSSSKSSSKSSSSSRTSRKTSDASGSIVSTTPEGTTTRTSVSGKTVTTVGNDD